MSKVPHPTAIEFAQAERLLKIDFSDGSHRELSTPFLRGFCPCAHCQGHAGGPPTWVPQRTDAATNVDDVHPIGSYAICIRWGDGHDTGIYTFKNLLEWRVPDDFDPDAIDEGTPLDADSL